LGKNNHDQLFQIWLTDVAKLRIYSASDKWVVLIQFSPSDRLLSLISEIDGNDFTELSRRKLLGVAVI
jgi:hypothetical protein